jgi:hypothetical protein
MTSRPSNERAHPDDPAVRSFPAAEARSTSLAPRLTLRGVRSAPVLLAIAVLGGSAPAALAQRPPRAGLGGGGLIAFNACDDIDGRGAVLRSVRPDGSRLRRLRTFFPHPDPLPCGAEGDPAWSGDGRRLLFLDGVRFTINDPAGRRVRHAVPPPGGTGVRAYRFSPGARSVTAIIAGVGPGRRDAIFRAGFDGRVRRRLTPYLVDDWVHPSRADVGADGNGAVEVCRIQCM